MRRACLPCAPCRLGVLSNSDDKWDILLPVNFGLSPFRCGGGHLEFFGFGPKMSRGGSSFSNSGAQIVFEDLKQTQTLIAATFSEKISVVDYHFGVGGWPGWEPE